MKKILIIREFDEFSRTLVENGFEIVNLPLIETKPLEDLRDFEAKLKTIENYSGIFITSQYSAQVLAQKIDELNINFTGKVYVFGKRSFDILKTGNLDLIYDDSVNTAREMLEKIAPEDLKNKRFLFVRGEKSLRIVPDFLAKFGKLDEAIVYETLQLKIEAAKIRDLRENFAENKIACACFFSPSAAESFIEQFGAEILHQTSIATIGKTTAEFFERRNLKVDFVSSKSNAESFAVELIEYLRKQN